MKIGYARVNAVSQNLENQKEALVNAGCEKILSEKVFGTKSNRKEFGTMMEFAGESDQTIVARLGSPSHSFIELQNTAKMLENKKIDLCGGMPEQDINTSDPSRKLLFSMIGIVAEFEREMINEMVEEEQKAAMENGVKSGRKKMLKADEISKIKKLASNGLAKKKVGKRFGASRSTVYRALED